MILFFFLFRWVDFVMRGKEKVAKQNKTKKKNPAPLVDRLFLGFCLFLCVCEGEYSLEGALGPLGLWAPVLAFDFFVAKLHTHLCKVMLSVIFPPRPTNQFFWAQNIFLGILSQRSFPSRTQGLRDFATCEKSRTLLTHSFFYSWKSTW